MEFLPSKKVLSVFVLVFALVVSTIIVFNGRSGKESNKNLNSSAKLASGDKFEIPENSNWQNELSELDMHSSATSTASSTETLTDTISKSLMSNYLALKQSGDLDQTSMQKLVDQTLNYTENSGSDLNENLIQTSNLRIIPNNGTQSMKEYGENFGQILKKNSSTNPKNEIEIMSEIVKSQDPEKISELKSVIKIYQTVLNELVVMSVPKTFIKVHLDAVNSLNNIVKSLTTIENIESDPVAGLSAMETYSKNGQIFVNARRAIIDYLTKNKISYEQGSGGYYLMNGL